MTTSLWSRAAPKRASAQAAELASFSTTTGRLVRLCTASPKRLLAPGEVGREPHDRARLVDETWRTDADALDLVRKRELGGETRHGIDSRCRIGGRGFAAQLRENVPVVIHDAGGDLGAADVYPDGQGHVSPRPSS